MNHHYESVDISRFDSFRSRKRTQQPNSCSGELKEFEEYINLCPRHWYIYKLVETHSSTQQQNLETFVYSVKDVINKSTMKVIGGLLLWGIFNGRKNSNGNPIKEIFQFYILLV